jgi:hypothetical protein
VELTAMPESDALAAALLQLSDHAARLQELDQREASHTDQTSERISALTTLSNAMKRTLDDQAEILAGLKDLDTKVRNLAAGLGGSCPNGNGSDAERGYQPSPTPRFWKLDGTARDEAIIRLRAWVEHVYQPGYGQLAATLSPCWDQHPLCLYALDWMSELWSVLYLQARRTPGSLASQAEWQTRLLTAAAEQMAAETSRCEHASLRRPHPVQMGSRL